MNFKKLLLFVAAPLMLVLAGCQPEPETPSYAACEVVDAEGNALTELSFTAEAGSQTFTIKATRSWTITTTADWYGVTPSSMTNTDNTEKSTVVIVSALANDGEARSISLTITCGDLEPINITVSQADKDGNQGATNGATIATVAEFIAAVDDGKLYQLTGEVTGVYNTQYGNFYLKDNTGSLQVYGTYQNGEKCWEKLGLKNGDIITVQGYSTTYNGNNQMKNAEYISHKAGEVNPDMPTKPEDVVIPTGAVVWNIGAANQNWVAESDATLGAGYAATVNNLKVACYQRNSTTAIVGAKDDHLRVYKNSALVITPLDGRKITKVMILCTGPAEYDGKTTHYTFDMVVSDGTTATSSQDAQVVMWSGNTDKFEAYADFGQIRMKTLAVVLDGEGSGTVTPEPEPTPGEKTYITLAEALATTGNFASNAYVKVKVISNSVLNNLTSNKNAHVQDETAGIGLRFTANHTYKFGDELEIKVGGLAVSEYNGAKQLNNVPNANVTVLSQNNTITPKTVAMADFLANKYENQYIALENVQVVDADLTKTWTVTTAQNHTSINMTDANGNTFIVFTSKYSTALEKTVAQGSGTIKGIATTNTDKEGVTHRQIVFAQESDYAGLTGTRFTVGQGGTTEPDPTPDPEPELPTDLAGSGEGTEASPYDVTRALDIINRGIAATDAVYTKGIVSSITEVNTSYGNATFQISVDGTTTTELIVFRSKYLNGEKFTAEDQIKVGDEVVVVGVLVLYNDTTPEISTCNLVSLKSADQGGEDTPVTPDPPLLPTPLPVRANGQVVTTSAQWMQTRIMVTTTLPPVGR